MKWIKYQIVQSEIDGEVILITKKIGYSEANLAIAEAEAYNGEYEIVEEEGPDIIPLAVELGGTGSKTVDEFKRKFDLVEFVLEEQVLTFVDKICVIEDERITESSLADVYFTSDTYDHAKECVIVVDTADGSLTLTATKQPTEEIKAVIRIKVV